MLCVGLVVSMGVTAGAAAGPTEDVEDSGWGVVINGEYTPGAEIDVLFPETGSRPGEVTPMLLDPVDLVACNVLNQVDHEVRRIDDVKYFSSLGGGSVSLTCGDSKHGYRHIRDRHQQDWQNVIAKVDDTHSRWDDFMFFVVRESLTYPARVVDKSDNKICYTAPIILINSDMVPVYEFHPTVIIGADTKKVITAHPGDRC
ncbi:hypothetical protein Sked_03030 [Sanguibacter keddieii DSM 10542]|uniref:Uncharacterized protein n=2 Tax=Sanguibacter keddieii TaxID=60920 RepID=D1BJL5_SANKS|nr:hypothetical protein Sked_03030 [Sanguibacter keddieii DSM 10542]